MCEVRETFLVINAFFERGFGGSGGCRGFFVRDEGDEWDFLNYPFHPLYPCKSLLLSDPPNPRSKKCVHHVPLSVILSCQKPIVVYSAQAIDAVVFDLDIPLLGLP